MEYGLGVSQKHGQSEIKKHSEGFEMWLWRRVKKDWINKIRNYEILRKIKEET